nr:MAG TPA: hypothetical protein [Caudoviricetes sp.]
MSGSLTRRRRRSGCHRGLTCRKSCLPLGQDFPQPLKMLRRAYTLWTCLSAQRGRCLSG